MTPAVTKPLSRLLGDVEVRSQQGPDVEVAAVVADTRAVVPGALFCCVPGSSVDGHDLAGSAVAAGAVALLVERPLAVAATQVQVQSTRRAMGPVAAAFHEHPSGALQVVGVTGTNGKTTTVHLLAGVLEAHGWPTAVLGTLSGARTTPEAPVLQETLAGFRDEGRRAVAMEVSSHALDQHRVEATRFAVAVFTNLSQDHLDYHGSLECYFQAKARLFSPGYARAAAVNADDPWGRRLLDDARVPTVAYSLADAGELELSATGSRFTWDGHRVHLRLGGRFNVANALAAATAARVLDVPAGAVADGLSSVGIVPGRFELIDAGQPAVVIVDYAHTPDGLEHVLTEARRATGSGGRVLTVFGAGGERDHAKRGPMGEVATRLADLAVVTSDNPRSEDPSEIIAAVARGSRRPEVLVVEPDRRAAISLAVGELRPGDVLVVAGKGHETGQEVGGRVLAFDDRQVTREALERRTW